MKRPRLRRLIAATTVAILVGMTVSNATAASVGAGESTNRYPAQAAAFCGQLDGPVFGLREESVDPIALSTFSVAGMTYESADFDRATLGVFELAWTAKAEVCIDTDDNGGPLAASARAAACGDILIGATTWLYRVGPAEL